jgi:SPP1 gp7 family putative phage head morphogenesis protein
MAARKPTPPPGAEEIQQAAESALAWLQTVVGVEVTDATRAQLLALAAEEFEIATLSAELTITGAARTIVSAAARVVRDGVIPDAFGNPDRLQEMVTVGLERYDPRVAFQASVRSAYAAGREDRAREAGLPLRVYRTVGDDRVRESHALLNGVCLPESDKFWNDHAPPNGWNCRCITYGIDQQQQQELTDAGVDLQLEPPEERMVTHVNRATGETYQLPASIEPGWNFNPADRPEQLRWMLENRMRVLRELPPGDL